MSEEIEATVEEPTEAGIPTDAETAPAREPFDPEVLVAAVGAVIFASGEPVSPKELRAAFSDADKQEIDTALDSLDDRLRQAGVGLSIERIAGGFRVATESRVGSWVRRFFRQRNRTRLSAAALETLAIVAYRQPVTGPEIQAIRGKDPSGPLRNLVDKRMLKVLGRKKVVGSPLLYGTSKEFLVHFGLDSLKDLPSIDDFDEFVSVLEAGQGQLFDGDGEEVEIEPLEAPEIESDDPALEAAPEGAADSTADSEPDSATEEPTDPPPAVRVDPPSSTDH